VIKDKRLWGEIDIMSVDLFIGIIIGFALWPFILMLTNWVENLRDYYRNYLFEKEKERKRQHLLRLTYNYDDGYKWKNDKDWECIINCVIEKAV